MLQLQDTQTSHSAKQNIEQLTVNTTTTSHPLHSHKENSKKKKMFCWKTKNIQQQLICKQPENWFMNSAINRL